MFQTDHQCVTYEPPEFAVERPPARPRSYSFILSRYCRVREIHDAQEALVRIDNSGEIPIEELLALYEPVRNALAYRRLKGDPLSKREQLVLEMLNQLLSVLLEHPQPEPPAVTQAVEEAKLLLHQFEHG